MSNKFEINLEKLIEFFDQRPKHSMGHSGALAALFSEELALQMIKDYFGKTGEQVIADSPTCTPGKSGKRLDGWVLVKKDDKIICYQIEIKHISSHSYGWAPFVAKEGEALEKERIDRFNAFLGNPENDGIWKVLNKMSNPPIPKEYEGLHCDYRPLLCVWDGMHHKGKDESFFEVNLKEQFGKDAFKDKEHKDTCWVFSMSNYANYLLKNNGKMNFESEAVGNRLDWIKDILNLNS